MPRKKGADLLATWRTEPARFRAEVVTLPETGRPLGESLAPFQREDFNGCDTHRHAFLERARGHSKTFDAATLCATELVTGRPGVACYAVAADEEQGRLLLGDVVGIFQRAPLLAPLVKTTRTSIEVKATGSKLTVLPADAPGSYGLRPDLIVCDEIAEWRDRKMWDALWSATGKRPRCRVIVIGTAGWDLTSIAWEIRQIAEAEPDWYFSSRAQCAPWIDAKWLLQQERTLPAHVFQRLHQNRWVEGAGAFLSAADVDAIFADFPATAIRADALGLDVGLKKDRGVLAHVGVTDDALVCVLGLTTYTPPKGGQNDLREIESEATETALALRCPLALDPWQAVLLGQRAAGQGVEVLAYTFTADSRRKLFGRLLDLIRTKRFKCRPHDALRRELLGLVVQETTAGWRVDHRPGQFDDHVVAICLALAALADMVIVEAEIPPAEARALAAFAHAHECGLMVPPGGFENLALDDGGEPIDERYRDNTWGDLRLL